MILVAGFIWDESDRSLCCYKHKRRRNYCWTCKYSFIRTLLISKVIVGSSEITEAIAGTISGVSAGTVSAAGKAIVVDSNKHVDIIKTSQLHLGGSGDAVQVTSSANELNLTMVQVLEQLLTVKLLFTVQVVKLKLIEIQDFWSRYHCISCRYK